MKKKKNLLLTLIILSAGFFFSCNDKKSSNSGGESTVTSTETPQAKLASACPPGNSFYTLLLDSASVATLLANNSTKKLIVQFTSANSADTALSLVAYGAKTSNVVNAGPITLTPLSNPVTTFPSPIILGDQELTLKGIKTVLGLNGSGQINASKLKSLQFVPLKDGNNHIYYSVTIYKMTATSGSALTNPSPPAPPCENGCDY